MRVMHLPPALSVSLLFLVTQPLFASPLVEEVRPDNVVQDVEAEEEPLRPCNDTAEGHGDRLLMAQHAIEMQEVIKNKTTWLSRVHHRVTHSQEAFTASVVLALLLSVIVLAVAATKMWRDKTYRAIQQKQPVQYQAHSVRAEVLVKDMLKARARSFVDYFHKTEMRNKRKTASSTELRMETFLVSGNPGERGRPRSKSETDSANSSLFHRRLLLSSSTDDDEYWDDFASSSDDDEIFALDGRTGEWRGRGDQYFGDVIPIKNKNIASSAFSRTKALFSRQKNKFSVNADPDDSTVKLLALSSSSSSETDDFDHFRIG